MRAPLVFKDPAGAAAFAEWMTGRFPGLGADPLEASNATRPHRNEIVREAVNLGGEPMGLGPVVTEENAAEFARMAAESDTA